MNFPRATAAVLLLATIGVSGADAQTVKTGSAEPIQVGNVPDNIKVPAGNKVFRVGHGVGTQNYVCLPSGNDFKFVLFTPEATLFNEDGQQLTTHFFSPNPFEDGTIRVTWQHSRDSSTVRGKVRPADPAVPGDLGDSSTDAAFVAQGAVAWLKVTATATANGPTGGDTLTKTTFVQRLNTAGGLAPKEGCDSLASLGNQAFVPYTADYFFYTDQ